MYGPHLASMMTLAPFKGESEGDTLLAMDLIEDIDRALLRVRNGTKNFKIIACRFKILVRSRDWC